MMTCQKLIERIRYRIGEWRDGVALADQERRYRNSVILAYADDAQKEVARKLRQAQQHYLAAVATISYVASTKDYALPPRCVRVVGLERTDSDPDVILGLISLHGEHALDEATVSGTWFEGWRLFGDFIRISPTPEASETDNINVFCIVGPPTMQYGTGASPGATAITLSATPTEGSAVLRADYFNNCIIECTAGTTGAGARTRITAYTKAMVCTVDTWPTTPSGTVTYDIGTQVPDEYDEGVILGGAVRTLQGTESKLLPGLKEEYRNFLFELPMDAGLRTGGGGIDHTYDDYA